MGMGSTWCGMMLECVVHIDLVASFRVPIVPIWNFKLGLALNLNLLVCMDVCTHIRACVCVHVCVFVFMSAYVCVCVHACVHVCMHAYMCVCVGA